MNKLLSLLDRLSEGINGIFSKDGGKGREDPLAFSRQVMEREGPVRLTAAMAADMLGLALLSFSAVCCVITSFSLPLTMSAAPGRQDPYAALLFPLLLLSALTVLARFMIRRWKTATLAVTALFIVPNLLAAKNIYYSACTVISIITRDYAMVFGTPVVIFDGTEKNRSALWFMLCIGSLLVMLWQTAAVYGGYTGLEITLLILLLTPCSVIKEHTPAPWTVVMLAASACLIVMSAGAKRGGVTEGGTSAAKLIVPAALIALLPLFIQPPENYNAEHWIDKAVTAAGDFVERQSQKGSSDSGFMETVDNVMFGSRFSVETATELSDLTKAGPRRLSGKSVMNVKSNISGILYLRGASLARYENNAWSALPDGLPGAGSLADASERLQAYTASVMERTEYVRIETDREMNVIYTPYFYSGVSRMTVSADGAENVEQGYTVTIDGAAGGSFEGSVEYYDIENGEDGGFGGTWLLTADNVFKSAADSYLANTNNETEYTLICRMPQTGIKELDVSAYYDLPEYGTYSSEGEYGRFVRENYTYIPPEIRGDIERIARGNGLFDYSEKDAPYAVADFVRKSAVYDLNTPAVLKGEDFVLWFLEHSHSGYCVHFASSAALLLRAVGIPSRYVTGYVVYAENGKWTHVTSDDAHAWVEYYVDGVGWLPLEATAYSDSGIVMPTSAAEGETTGSTSSSTTAGTETAPSPDSTGPVSLTDGTKPDENGNNSGTKPDGSGSGTGGQGEGKHGGAGIALLILLPFAAGLIYLRRYLELRRREALYARSNGDRVLQLWTECEALLKKLGQQPPPEAKETAQRAAFSNHAIPKEDAELMERCRDSLVRKRTGGANVFSLLADRYIYILY